MTAGINLPAVRSDRTHADRGALRSIGRLVGLYLVSRRITVTVGLLALLGALLGATLYWRWNIAGGPAATQFLPLTIESAAAAVIAVATYSPFGESERSTGRALPVLRLTGAIGLMAVAIGALAAGASAGHLPGGTLALIRNLAGTTGIGLLAATALGGTFGWTGPLAYLLVTEGGLAAGWTTPWIWAAHQPQNQGAAGCAYLMFVLGGVLITVRGDRERITA